MKTNTDHWRSLINEAPISYESKKTLLEVAQYDAMIKGMFLQTLCHSEQRAEISHFFRYLILNIGPHNTQKAALYEELILALLEESEKTDNVAPSDTADFYTLLLSEALTKQALLNPYRMTVKDRHMIVEDESVLLLALEKLSDTAFAQILSHRQFVCAHNLLRPSLLLKAVEKGLTNKAVIILEAGQFTQEELQEAFFIALEGDDFPTLIEPLLSRGIDINQRYNKKLAIEVAVEGRQTHNLELLLSAGANPEISNNGRETPLMFAARTGRRQCMETLIRAGADINAYNPFTGMSALILSVQANQGTCTALLLHHGANIQQQDISGSSALDHAFSCGNDDVICMLQMAPSLTAHELARMDAIGSSVPNLKTIYRTQRNSLQQGLLSVGMVFSRLMPGRYGGWLLRLLAENILPAKTLHDRWTSTVTHHPQALAQFAARDFKGCVTLSLKCGTPHLNAQDNETGNTALIQAVNAKNLEIIDALLAAGANPAIMNHFGQSALSTLAFERDQDEQMLCRKLVCRLNGNSFYEMMSGSDYQASMSNREQAKTLLLDWWINDSPLNPTELPGDFLLKKGFYSLFPEALREMNLNTRQLDKLIQNALTWLGDNPDTEDELVKYFLGFKDVLSPHTLSQVIAPRINSLPTSTQNLFYGVLACRLRERPRTSETAESKTATGEAETKEPQQPYIPTSDSDDWTDSSSDESIWDKSYTDTAPNNGWGSDSDAQVGEVPLSPASSDGGWSSANESDAESEEFAHPDVSATSTSQAPAFESKHSTPERETKEQESPATSPENIQLAIPPAPEPALSLDPPYTHNLPNADPGYFSESESEFEVEVEETLQPAVGTPTPLEQIAAAPTQPKDMILEEPISPPPAIEPESAIAILEAETTGAEIGSGTEDEEQPQAPTTDHPNPQETAQNEPGTTTDSESEPEEAAHPASDGTPFPARPATPVTTQASVDGSPASFIDSSEPDHLQGHQEPPNPLAGINTREELRNYISDIQEESISAEQKQAIFGAYKRIREAEAPQFHNCFLQFFRVIFQCTLMVRTKTSKVNVAEKMSQGLFSELQATERKTLNNGLLKQINDLTLSK